MAGTISRLPLFALTGLLLTAPVCLAAPRKSLSEITVDVEAEGRPVLEVLRKLERDHELNYVVADRVLERAGLVNVHLRQVSLEDALHAISAACGLRLQIRGRIVILLPEATRAAVPAPVRGRRPLERRPEPEARREPRRKARPDDFAARPSEKRSNKNLARAVGEVLSVDVKKGHLQLDSDGLKVDFYAPTAAEAGDPSRAARMRSTLARLEVGHKVALEYRRLKSRLIIESLVGGTKVRDNALAMIRRKRGEGEEDDAKKERAPRRGKKRRGVTAKRNPLQAPESTGVVPDGVLTGTFVDYADEKARVKRGDGEVVSVYVPSDDADLRAKIVTVLERLKPGARVFFMYEGVDGKMILKSTGITEVKPGKK
jgi:hypothetical protein